MIVKLMDPKLHFVFFAFFGLLKEKKSWGVGLNFSFTLPKKIIIIIIIK